MRAQILLDPEGQRRRWRKQLKSLYKWKTLSKMQRRLIEMLLLTSK